MSAARNDDLAVIVHGGVGSKKVVAPDEREGVRDACEAAWKELSNSGDGLRAVVAGLTVLEENEIFDAGYGSYPNDQGQVFMDVGLMAGSGIFKSILNIARVRHPSLVALDNFNPARSLMRVWTQEDQTKLDASSSEIKARYGWVKTHEEMVSPMARAASDSFRGKEVHGTVGCLVRDAQGRLFAGTSTGGTAAKVVGRIGDSPIIGAGVYARDGITALSATGHGESILSSLISGHIISRIRADVQEASVILEEELQQFKSSYPVKRVGLILLPAGGVPLFGSIGGAMPVAWKTPSSDGIS